MQLTLQLAQGYDLNGNPGEPLFIYDENSSDGPLEVNPDITADELAFSSSPDESGNSDNLQALINISTEPLDIEGLGSVTVGEACSSIISNIGIYSQQNQTEAEAAANVYFRSADPAEQRQRGQHGRRSGEPHYLSADL